ncbi:MAG: serine hydrolase domain-containing protein [Sumerlaeia bacterium]
MISTRPAPPRLAVLAVLGLFFFSHALAQEPTVYPLVGSHSIPDALRRQLDAHRDLIPPGINTDRIASTGMDPAVFIEGIVQVADGVRQGELPGAVIHVGSLFGDGMPIPVGYKQTDPQLWPASWDTKYHLGTLTAQLTLLPARLRLIQAGEWDRSSGTDREESGAELAPCLGPAAQRLVAESLRVSERLGEPVLDHAFREWLEPFGLKNSAIELPANWRSTAAPGRYTGEKMNWGDPSDDAKVRFGPSTAHAGLYSTADDLDLYAKILIGTYHGLAPDFLTSETMRRESAPGHAFGWEADGWGPGTFGYLAENGCGMWIAPEDGNYLIILSNLDHPEGRCAADAPSLATLPALLATGRTRQTSAHDVLSVMTGGIEEGGESAP